MNSRRQRKYSTLADGMLKVDSEGKNHSRLGSGFCMFYTHLCVSGIQYTIAVHGKIDNVSHFYLELNAQV